MEQSARVCWIETDQPWVLESALFQAVSLPLNLDQNRNHPFHGEQEGNRFREHMP
jgi:hypothetical protein